MNHPAQSIARLSVMDASNTGWLLASVFGEENSSNHVAQPVNSVDVIERRRADTRVPTQSPGNRRGPRGCYSRRECTPLWWN